jgi:hypothetical protein
MRDYHGTALLMPDGRVLVAAGSESGGAPDQRNAEFFSPPYLFRGARPTISSAPATLRYGQTFRILTANASSIAKVSLIRLATVTHAFDENGRQLRLTFTKDATGLTVTAPSSGNIAPPGYYMVFIANGTDVPSVPGSSRSSRPAAQLSERRFGCKVSVDCGRAIGVRRVRTPC